MGLLGLAVSCQTRAARGPGENRHAPPAHPFQPAPLRAHPSPPPTRPSPPQLGYNLLGYLLLRFTKPRYLPLTQTAAAKKKA